MKKQKELLVKKSALQEYIQEEGSYPFESMKVKFFLYSCSKQNQVPLELLLEDIYARVSFFPCDNFTICFYFGQESLDLQNVFTTIQADFGENIQVHEGFYLTKNITGKEIETYCSLVQKAYFGSSSSYTRVSNLLFTIENEDKFFVANLLANKALAKLLNDKETENMINTFFKNDLNVLKTSRALYVHRNTLLYKLDSFNKETNFDLQNFFDASCINLLMASRLR
jgi:hypothetical protein